MKSKVFLLTLAVLLVVGVVAATAQDRAGCSSCSSVKTAALTEDDQSCSCGECATCKAAVEEAVKSACGCGECASCKASLETAGNQTSCPVMGGDINREFYTDHDGKRVYFCCEGCIKAFDEDPQKYLKKLEQDGVKLESVPKKDDVKKT